MELSSSPRRHGCESRRRGSPKRDGCATPKEESYMGTRTRGSRKLWTLTAFILPATLILSACGGEQSTFSKIGSGLLGNNAAAESTATTGAGAMNYPTVTSAMAADQSLKQVAPTGTEQQEPGPDVPQPPVQEPNPFVDTTQDHLSTFAMDVDTGSY